ncbi:MAG: CBS domain-containing protein [Chloroflexota bacterium]
MTEEQPTQPKLVRDLMTVGVLTCSPTTSIQVISQALLEKELEAVVVLDHDGHAVGIVGRSELVNAYTNPNHKQLTAEDIMQDGIPQIPPDIPLTAAAQLMQDQDVRVFFLTHRAGGIEYPAAQLAYRHFLKYLASENPEDHNDLGIRAERKAPLEMFYERRDKQREQNQNSHLD